MKCRKSFMSERDSSYLGSIGLLGEYYPTSRKKYICSLEEVGCMHLEPFQTSVVTQGSTWQLYISSAVAWPWTEEESHSSSFVVSSNCTPCFCYI